MSTRTWVLLGATSIIAKHFAHIAAQAGYSLHLVGRDSEHLDVLCNDITLRFQVPCTFHVIDTTDPQAFEANIFGNNANEWDLFIAQSDFTNNDQLTQHTITQLIEVNIRSIALSIHHYFQRKQKHHNLVYLSSVAACRGRAKNSLYGASKAAIEVYLQGLQQAATKNQSISIMRLGYIDTKQTYGVPGIFYAASPKKCAKACWDAVYKRKSLVYYPSFWRGIMAIVRGIPFFLYCKMRSF